MANTDDDLSALTDEALAAKADELAGVAEAMRAKGDRGADRAAGAAQTLRDMISRRALAASEAANYARANALPEIEETKE